MPYIPPIKCPLCEEYMKYQPYKETHIWICPECPAVVFEYWHYGDATAVVEKLNR